MKVLKFGGSSVADASRMTGVIDIVSAEALADRVILVCSAISGCTDALLETGHTGDPERRRCLIDALRQRHENIVTELFSGKERADALEELSSLFNELSAADPDESVTYGELFSTRIMARKLAASGMAAGWLDSRKLIRVDGGGVDFERSYACIASAIAASPQTRVFVAPGFIASDASGRVTTLGRGGSDYSAAIYAAGSHAQALEIWTDVPGIMTANPDLVPSASTVPEISYRAASDMAGNGAKVLYAPTVRPAMDAGLAINIRNTFDPAGKGTVICAHPAAEAGSWVGVTSLDIPGTEDTAVCLVGESVPDRQAAAVRMLSALNASGIMPLGEIGGDGSCFKARVSRSLSKAAVASLHHEFFEK